MTTDLIKSELDRYGILKTRFGSIDFFLSLYNQTFSNDYHLYRLIQFPINQVRVLNRNSYQFSLIKRLNNTLEFDSVDTTVPYSVLNFRGEKLYSVADHNGLFGATELDQLLLENQIPLGMYILEYDSFRKTEYVALIIDNSEEDIQLPQYSIQLNNQTAEFNYQFTNSVVFFSNTPFTVLALPKPINTEMNLNRINSDPNLVTYTSKGNQVSFAVNESLWLAVIKEGELSPFNSIEGIGVDRLINPLVNIYHLVLNTNYTKSYIRRLTGISEFSSQEVQLTVQV